MTEKEQKKAAKKFAEYWKGKGDEKGESQPFWLSLLRDVFGIEYPEQYISFEDRVFLGHTSFIDGYIEATNVLIEQKKIGKSLTTPVRQSDRTMLTPFQQAQRYSASLPYSKQPRWIITCNFEEFLVYDMEQPGGSPESIYLKDFEKEYYRLQFLIDNTKNHIKNEMEVSIQAGEIVGLLYDAFLKQYKHPENEESLKSLNMLCVRLVFCLYAEDSGIFGKHNMFHDYLNGYEAKNMRRALIDLFQVLDTKEEDRDEYLEEDLLAFPYVNGGLFADENIEIPQFTQEIRDLLLEKASADFDWSEISPTIFGAVFESTLNPETRRSGGMHYTSIENIHKVIDPLFLDGLQKELDEIKSLKTIKSKKTRLENFQNKIASLKFMDPACGSGNFLTETYLSLRHIENEVIQMLTDEGFTGQMGFIVEHYNPIQVSIGQFYGIEINDFAVTVARTALWIAENQMMKITEDILHMDLDFLPLKSYANIHEGNALMLDWNQVIPNIELNYIMGNPPFVGGMYMNEIQKKEMREIFDGVKGAGEMDYVCAWYKCATQYMKATKIRAAFVSTNSICQGGQVLTFWKHMIENYSIHIDFAHKTFVWNNEAKNQAKVHCVIVGFSGKHVTDTTKILYSDGTSKICRNISPYLNDTPTFFIESRSTPLCDVPKMRFGSMPRDGGGFVLTKEEKERLIKKEPDTKKWIKPYIGATEFLNNKERYCLWLVDAKPSELKKCPEVMKRIEKIREFRASSKAAGTRKFASTPTVFCQIAQPDSDYIIVPKTSSGKRRYIPLGFRDKDTIASDLVFLIPNASLYEFGILLSNIHNSWMRQVAGRLKSDYRYSKDIVYNNFPWIDLNGDEKKEIEKTALEILKARDNHPTSTLAIMYDDNLMPPELQKAHQNNDKAVMKAYGFIKKDQQGKKHWYNESECVSALMKMYQKLAEENSL